MAAKVVDADDIGMIQPCGILRLPAESGNEGLVLGELRVEDLDGDATTQGHVLCGEDISHPAPGEMPGDSIAALQYAFFSHGGEW